MSFATLINAFIGMALTFAAMALLVSTVTEGVSSALKWRSATLLDGLKSLLNVQPSPGLLKMMPPGLGGIVPPARNLAAAVVAAGAVPQQAAGAVKAAQTARAVAALQALGKPFTLPPAPAISGGQLLCSLLNHGAVNPRMPGANAATSAKNAPSYIAPANFASAFIDILHDASPAAAAASLAAGIDNIDDYQLRQMLTGMYRRTGEDLDKFKTELTTWFDAAMDRVGGAYKRYTQFWNFVIGLVLAFLFNVDAICIVQALLSNPTLVASIDISGIKADDVDALHKLYSGGFPIGWTVPDGTDFCTFLKGMICSLWTQPGHDLVRFAGWAITAVAALFGAPFWFDTLKRFVQLRGTGDKPAPTPPAKPAAAR